MIQSTVSLQKGFTLIELLLFVLLISILGILSTGFYARFYTQNSVTAVTDQLTQELRKAQGYAMAGKQGGSWGVHNGTNQLTMFQGGTYVGRNMAFDETFPINGNITVTGFTDEIFSRVTGTPSAATTVTITGDTNIRTVTINNQGVISR